MPLLIALGSLLIVAAAELLWPRRRREFPALRRRLGNLGIWVLNLLLGAFVFMSPAAFRGQLAAIWGVALPAWPITNSALTFVAGFLLLDFLRYAVHRCQHAVPFLWRLHAMHHSDPDVDFTTAVRHHPVESLIAGGVYWLAALVVDIPVLVTVSHALVVFAAAAFTHGNMRLPEWFEHWLQPVVITLDLHLVHHSLVYEEANANFGAVLSIWDRMFGTLVRLPRRRQQQLEFGVSDLSRRDALKPSAMLLTPWLIGRADQARRAASTS
jgi:sterol desaturase/sphingolipid hydroxylase (fatty acid hydroxylase superfamily)